MNILLINLEKTWRGGERQIEILADYIQNSGSHAFIAYPKKSDGFKKYKQKFSTLGLSSRLPIDPRNIIQLIGFCKRNKIDVIHANSSKSHDLALMVKKFLPHLKLVVHRRIDGSISNRMSTRKKYHSALVDSYVAISKSVKKALTDFGIEDQKISLIPSGIDIHEFKKTKQEAKTDFAKQYHLDQNKIWIGIAAAMTKEKGVDDFICSAKIALKMNPGLLFLIAGEGKNLNQYKKMVADLNMSDQVLFLGQLEPIYDFMRSLDVYFMPSKIEGLGTAFLHAMQAETLLIGTNTGGIPDIIEHNKTGYLVEIGDINAAGFLLAKYNKERAISMAALATAKFAKQFTAERMAEANYKNYQRLLDLI